MFRVGDIVKVFDYETYFHFDVCSFDQIQPKKSVDPDFYIIKI